VGRNNAEIANTAGIREAASNSNHSSCYGSVTTQRSRIAPTATFQLVHAYFGSLAGLIGSREGRSRDREAHERGLAELLAGQTRSTGDKGTRIRFLSPIVREGAVADVIGKEAHDAAADLLVLGTHSRSAVAQALLGSIAAAFLNHPPCDVLVVPAA
jgi:nucleotide-binding universal stress UspA family protein